MGFDGDAFVQDMRQELIDSGRTLDRSDWVEKVVQGEATKEELVGWARQHYWGVTLPHPPHPGRLDDPHARTR